jgi:hypothetical protein
MTSIESIREGFPFITIAKQPGLPTYKTIAKVHLKLKANAEVLLLTSSIDITSSKNQSKPTR